jgi:hypothetical protein
MNGRAALAGERRSNHYFQSRPIHGRVARTQSPKTNLGSPYAGRAFGAFDFPWIIPCRPSEEPRSIPFSISQFQFIS